jgi:hypothetical protein
MVKIKDKRKKIKVKSGERKDKRQKLKDKN